MRVAAVVVLVVLAGCSFAVPGQDSDTVTPAPVPTDDRYPLGVGPDGVTDPALAASKHAAALQNTSYTVVSNRTVRTLDGSLRSRLDVTLQLSASRHYHANVSVRGPNAPVFLGDPPTQAEYWANDEVYLRKQVIDNRTEYSRYGTSEEYVGTWRFWLGSVALDLGPESDVRSVFGSFRTSVAGQTEVDGERRTHLVGTTVRSERFVDDQSDLRSVENATLHAFVTESGLVDSYQVTYTATRRDGTRVRVRRSVAFSDVGNTTIDRPTWYDAAMAQG